MFCLVIWVYSHFPVNLNSIDRSKDRFITNLFYKLVHWWDMIRDSNYYRVQASCSRSELLRDVHFWHKK